MTPMPTVQYASLQLFIYAVVAGILASVVDDEIALLRSRDRSFSHALTERPTDDPLYQKQLGELAATAYIAKAAVLDAAEAIAAATASEALTGTQGLFDAVRRVANRDKLTLRDVGKWYAQGVLLPQFVGTAEQVADQIEESFKAREADGFMVSVAQTPGTFNDFVDSVVPELQHRGLFRTEYTGNTLRAHLGLGPAQLTAPQLSVAS
jgi:hypothetical protein